MASSRTVIIGGGSASVKCAKTLRKMLPHRKNVYARSAEVVGGSAVVSYDILNKYI